jgi:hypothetical protein
MVDEGIAHHGNQSKLLTKPQLSVSAYFSVAWGYFSCNGGAAMRLNK